MLAVRARKGSILPGGYFGGAVIRRRRNRSHNRHTITGAGIGGPPVIPINRRLLVLTTGAKLLRSLSTGAAGSDCDSAVLSSIGVGETS